VPTFADRRVSHGQCGGSPTAVISVSRPDFTRTLAQSTSIGHSHKALHEIARTKLFTRTLAQSSSLEHSLKIMYMYYSAKIASLLAHLSSPFSPPWNARLMGHFIHLIWTITWSVYGRSDTGIVGSNPTRGMDVLCVCVFCVHIALCEGRRLATDWSLAQEVPLTVHRIDSVPLVRERTIPTERPPLVGKVSANFCW
jgi:hypothetical protein